MPNQNDKILPSQVSMRQLRCFLAVARTGSVTKAAEQMNTAQPGVSRTIREFEAEIGYAVFNRTPSGLSLNTAGQVLYRHVSDGLHRIQGGIDGLREDKTNKRVVVYALPNIIRTILPRAVAKFKKRNPDVDVIILSIGLVSLPDLLRRGSVDFGFGRLQSVTKLQGLKFEHLFSEPLVWFVGNDHPLLKRQSVTIGDLAQFEVILPAKDTIIRNEINQYLASRGAGEFPNTIETISFEFSRNYLQNTDAVVLMPLGTMRQELEAGAVQILPIEREPLMGSVGITTAAEYDLSPLAQDLVDLIREDVSETS